VPGREEPSIGFTAILNDPAHGARAVPLTALLAGMLSNGEATPAERRQKVRAFGRK